MEDAHVLDRRSSRRARHADIPNFPRSYDISRDWVDKFQAGALTETDLKNYWRNELPKIALFENAGEFPEWLFEVDAVQGALFGTLEEFLCNCSTPDQTLEAIRDADGALTICGHVFKMSEPTYNCRECCTDPTCVLCVDCFKNSEHRNHKYKMSTSNGGGCCDCGDLEAWKKYPICSIHYDDSDPEATVAELPEDMVARAKFLFRVVLRYAYRLLTIDHAPELPSDLQGVPNREEGTAVYETPDTYCTVVYNDETHTFESVINTLSKVLMSSQKEAIEYVTSIDREGRSIIKCSSFKECNHMLTEVERITTRTAGKPLKVQVKHMFVVAHQTFAIKLLAWFQNILSYSVAIRRIFTEVVTEPNGTEPPIIEGVMLRDSMMWKTARVNFHRLFISGMMKEYENKKTFARIFTKNYSIVMKDFIRDDHDHSYSVAAMAVQIFTVPSIAHYLIAYQDVLFNLLNTFLSECNSIIKDGKLEFQRTEATLTFKRAQFILYDVQYLLATIPEQWSEELRKGFQQGLSHFLRLLALMQNMDPTKRQVGQHMEYEPDWETGFNLHIKLTTAITYMLRWCGSDKQTLTKAFRLTSKLLHENGGKMMKDMTVCKFGQHTATCIVYDVSKLLVSIHLPLTRFMAGLSLYLPRHELHYYSEEFTAKPTPEELIEPVLRLKVMIAQVHAGMWRRNGYSILHQIFFYRNPKCRVEMLNKDNVILQIGASLMESNTFLIHLLYKFDLLGWAEPNYDEIVKNDDDNLKYKITLVEEFLSLLIAIVGERYVVGVGQVTEMDCVKKEVIQRLCVQPLTHSELSKGICHTVTDLQIDEVVSEIAYFEKPKSSPVKGVFRLKSEYFKEYNMFYYNYSKEDASRSEEVQRKWRREQGHLDCCPPPRLPPLTDQFKVMLNILQCDVMLELMCTILKRAANLKCRSFSDLQLHRLMYLIGYALNEESEQRYEFFTFTERAKKYELKSLLEALVDEERVESYNDTIKWTVNWYREVEQMAADATKKSCPTPMEVEPEEDNSNSQSATNKERERKRLAALGAKRREMVMAQIRSAQSMFMMENRESYDEVSTYEEEQMSCEPVAEAEFPLAVGPQRSPAAYPEKSYVCILCQERQTVRADAPAMVYSAYVQKSTVVRNETPSFTQRMKQSDVYFLPTNLSPSPYVSICGHVMHSACFDKYFNNISTKENRRPYRLRQPISFDVEKQEFQCPLCESLSNTVLPIMPALPNVGKQPATTDNNITFEAWVFSVSFPDEARKSTNSTGDAKRAASDAPGTSKRDRKEDTSETQEAGESSSSTENTAATTSTTETEGTTTSAEEAASDEPKPPGTEDTADDESDDDDEDNYLDQDITQVAFWESALGHSYDIPQLGVEQVDRIFVSERVELTVLNTQQEAVQGYNEPPARTLSVSICDTVKQFTRMAFLKGVGTNTEDMPKCVFFTWKACSYTIHAIEVVLRHEKKALLGGLTIRQKKCIKSMIRACAVLEMCYNQRILNHYATLMFRVIFDRSSTFPESTFMDWDPFGMLVTIVLSQQSIFSMDYPTMLPCGGLLDSYILRLMLLASVSQILTGLSIPEECYFEESEEITVDPSTESILTYLKLIHPLKFARVNTAKVWARTKKVVAPFLRCACLFFRYLTGVKLPKCLKEFEGDTYENMCRYLGMPSSCNLLLDDPVSMNIFKGWIANWKTQQRRIMVQMLLLGRDLSKVKRALRYESYLELRGLIRLPEDYSEMINSVSLFTCPNSDHEDSRNPTLCLVCGMMLCSQSYCCQREFNSILIGSCTYHAYTCGGGSGIFLRVRECEILLLSCPNRGCFLPAPFLDEYGETDQGLRRGNPLKLNVRQYQLLEKMWMNHNIHQEVSRNIESSHVTGITQWQHL